MESHIFVTLRWLLLGLIELHFLGLNLAHVALVANFSKGEVVVAASLASPVADSLSGFLEGDWAALWDNLLHSFSVHILLG